MKKKINTLIVCLIFLFVTLSFAVLTIEIMKKQTVLTGDFDLMNEKTLLKIYML